MHRLLGALLEQSEFELVQFQNQVSKGGASIPDAIIHASILLLVETKIERNAINVAQIKNHLERLDNSSESTKVLLVITPDDTRPVALNAIEDDRVVWASFTAIDQAIDEMLDDKYEVTSERESFLLRELQSMLSAEGLLASPNDVVVVAARNAWPEYNQIHAYVCQPNRPFQQVKRIAFYSEGQVHPLLPKIVHSYDNVVMEVEKAPAAIADLVRRIIKEQRRKAGDRFKVLLLSAPDSPDTLRLIGPIPNNMQSKSGKPTAFTMGQRYISSERLGNAKTTSDLV
jgi:hypothetical protein